MKSGVVLKTDRGKAVVLLSGGQFIQVRARREWKKGDVVTIEPPRGQVKIMRFGLAACLAMVTVLGIVGVQWYVQPVALVSVDINPAVEMNLNRMDRVVSVRAMNDGGEEITREIRVQNKTVADALNEIAVNASFERYLNDNSIITFSVSANDPLKQKELLDSLQQTANKTILSHHSAQVEYFTVEKDMVEQAHGLGVTPGKYIYLMKLQKVSPDIDIQDYCHHSISEIQRQIDTCMETHASGSEGRHGGASHGHRR